MNWEWKNVSEEEFESKRKDSTYYRIYHNENDKDVIDYKFWEKNDDSALKILNKFKNDHNDGKEYFYSTSGYYSSDNKRYDTMKEMHEDWKNSEYTEEDRKIDIERINEYKREIIEADQITLFNKCNLKIDKIKEKEEEYKIRKERILKKLTNLDISNLKEKEYDEIIDELHDINQIYYDIQEFEILINTGHKQSESWSIYDHILDDLEYNLPILIKSKMGTPTTFCVKAAEKLGTMTKDKYEFSNEESKLASDMWNKELETLLLNVKLYKYYENFGIIDNKNEDEVKFNDEWKNTIPYKNGTNKELDYTKLRELSQSCWNFIWDWMNEYGESLWD